MSNLDALKPYFLTGTAEGDRHFLAKAFIAPHQLPSLFGIEPGGMRIVVGNKGIGKSAILEFVKKVAGRRSLPCLLLHPDDLETKGLAGLVDVGAMKRELFNTLLRATGVQIGAQLGGLLIGDKAKLHAAAQKAGKTTPDFVQKSLALLTAISVPVKGINGVQLAKDLAGELNSDAMIRSINGTLLSEGSVFFLLIDDTDQVADPGTPAHLNRIWALLLAVRKLAGDCPAIRCIVSLRTEIWNRLVSEAGANRDQTDHMRGLVINLVATDELMEDIILRRLTLAAQDVGKSRTDPYEVFFDGLRVHLPQSDEQRSWPSFIVKSARERPRDAIQFMMKMIEAGDKAKPRAERIGGKEAAEGMKTYSSERVDDLSKEFAPDCSTVKQIVNTFASIPFDTDFETIRAHVRGIPSSFSLTLRGATIKPQEDESAVALLAFLHEMGFVNPRIPDSREPRKFRHITFNQDPTFVNRANWNVMQAARWEVHPAFRTHLLLKRLDDQSRLLSPESKN